jgi:hypothetical protein
MVDKPLQDLQEKVVGVQAIKRRKKTTHTTTISLEAHLSSSSSNHVSTTFCTLTLHFCTLVFLYSFALQPLMQRFLSLGTDCVKIQETADESKGFFLLLFIALVLFS